MLNPIPNVRGSGYDVIKKLRFRERKFALFFKHELPPPDSGAGSTFHTVFMFNRVKGCRFFVDVDVEQNFGLWSYCKPTVLCGKDK